MMRLSTMWAVDRTIDANGRSPIADEVIAAWAHDQGTARFFRSSANFLYSFEREGERQFLRFAVDSERSGATIEAEVALLDWLAGEGLRVAAPVRSLSGNAVETIETAVGIVHAVVFPGLEGEQPEIDDLDDAKFRRWGAALGGLHAAVMRSPAIGDARRPTWQHHLGFIDASLARDDVGPRRELAELASALVALPRSPETYGLIHFDFELDNLVWSDGEVGMLDFDDAAHYWYGADIAFALRDLFEAGFDTEDSSFRAFMEGYRTQRDVDGGEIDQIPLFLRLSELMGHARLTRSLDLAEDGDYPDWMTGLNQRLQSRMASYRASLGG